MALQSRLCHRARGKGAKYWQVARRLCVVNASGRRQFAFIGPPAPVLFHKVPGLVHHRDLPQSFSASHLLLSLTR
jgi:hypothetical protein